jgi:nickel/cobalt exporter
MAEAALYLVSGFWLGALHAATPGHGKTIAAAYLVGARGRPVDAVALGVFVTLSHTSGIVAFALLATLGSTLLSQRVESYLALAVGVFVAGLGASMLAGRWRGRGRADRPAEGGDHHHEGGHSLGGDGAVYHQHGLGPWHSHRLDALAVVRPSWLMLLGLGIAGGVLPDPAALAVLLAAIAQGRLVLGVLTVVVFSLGFASVLVVVGLAAARVGRAVLDWLDSRWLARLQLVTAAAISGVGVLLTLAAWRTLAPWP